MRFLTTIMGRIGACTLAFCVALSLGALTASADEIAGEITAFIGDSRDSAINEGENIELGEDGACSILVDQDALLELCGTTSLALRKDPKSNRRIIALNRGEIKVVVEPRDFNERIEIHTPAAIATLLGTVVYVSIDPKTQATTITSAESKVSVRSGDPRIQGKTILKPAQQVTVTLGGGLPAEPIHLDRAQVAELGGCLVNFHETALGRDSNIHGRRVADRLTALDIIGGQEGGQLPSSRATSDSFSPGQAHGAPMTEQDEACVMPHCGDVGALEDSERR